MSYLKFLKSREKKTLLGELNLIYGITKLPNILLETGKMKLRAFTGSLTQDEMKQLALIARIEIIGMYYLSRKDEDARLNFDAVSLYRNQITKSIIEISQDEFEEYIRGLDLKKEVQRGTIVIKYDKNLIGVAKSNGEKIFNYIPKERKLKTSLKSKSQPSEKN